MHIKDNLINFLYDKNYFITMYDDYIHIFNYLELIKLSEKEIELKLDSFNIKINGNNLFIIKMLPNELLIKGSITSIGKKNE